MERKKQLNETKQQKPGQINDQKAAQVHQTETKGHNIASGQAERIPQKAAEKMPEEIFLPDDIDRKRKQDQANQDVLIMDYDPRSASKMVDQSGPKNIDPEVLSKERMEEQEMFKNHILMEDRKRMYRDFKTAQMSDETEEDLEDSKFRK